MAAAAVAAPVSEREARKLAAAATEAATRARKERLAKFFGAAEPLSARELGVRPREEMQEEPSDRQPPATTGNLPPRWDSAIAGVGSGGGGGGDGGGLATEADVMGKVLVIAGPTNVGKTQLGYEMALRLGGEVVCCDSMQSYIGMNVATGGPTAAMCARVRHHLLDTVHPWDDWSAGHQG